jgi:hypothetical protein
MENIKNNKNTTLSDKIDAGVYRYIEGISKSRSLPVFLFSESQIYVRHFFNQVKIS